MLVRHLPTPLAFAWTVATLTDAIIHWRHHAYFRAVCDNNEHGGSTPTP